MPITNVSTSKNSVCVTEADAKHQLLHFCLHASHVEANSFQYSSYGFIFWAYEHRIKFLWTWPA